MATFTNEDWVPLKKCSKILEWRAIQTLKNHIVSGVRYPFMAKDIHGRWLGNDGVFEQWNLRNKK